MSASAFLFMKDCYVLISFSPILVLSQWLIFGFDDFQSKVFVPLRYPVLTEVAHPIIITETLLEGITSKCTQIEAAPLKDQASTGKYSSGTPKQRNG
jgi:hypothetical protein